MNPDAQNQQPMMQPGTPQAGAGNPQPVDPYGAYGPQPAVAASAGYVPEQQYAYPPQAMPPGYAPQQMPPQMQQPPVAGVGVGGQVPPQQKPPAPKANPNSTQNMLQIAEIRDGIVIMNDGSYRCVVMVKSINFDLMSPEEREAVEYSYQGFLNSLYFPIQIYIRSQKIDIRPYLEHLDKIRQEHDNMLLALLIEDYLGFVDNLAMQTNIMDKKIYVVIPFFPVADVQKAITQSANFFTGIKNIFSPVQTHVTINEADLAKAKDELRNRVQSVLGGLAQCGVQGLPLDTQELIELYYGAYNPETAVRQQLKNFNDISVPVVTKGEGLAPQPHLDRSLQ